MLEIMPILGLSFEPTKLLSFSYASINSGPKNKSQRFQECNALLMDVRSNDPGTCNNILVKRFEMPDSKPHAPELKKGLHLLKSVQLQEGLESCSTMEELKQYHSQIIKLGLSGDNDTMGRVIKVCVISKYGDFGYALSVFNKMPHPDAFIYNTIFRGYSHFHLTKDCISLYLQMLQNSVMPNKFTFPLLIRACSSENASEQGKQVHAQTLKFGYGSDSFSQNNLIHMYVSFKNLEDARKMFDKMPQQNVVSWTTLISGYSQSGYVDEARELFELMPETERNPASWNAMIAAYVQNNRFHDAFNVFDEMWSKQFPLDKFVAASMLSACTGLGAMKQGEWIHSYIKTNGIKVDSKLATTIIDMYCKCGSLDKAFEVFNEFVSVSISVSSWNCMIGGFAMHGKGEEAIKLFKKMESKSIRPDHITFVNILSACAHSGLIEKGRYYFRYMVKAYDLSPKMEHYGCMVDLLGRAGKLNEAMKLICDMPFSPDVRVLGALLGACRIHKNIELGEHIGKRLIEMEPNNSGRYVLLANIYATASRYKDVANVRKLMNDRGVKKGRGFSLIEMDGVVNEFIAGGRTHCESKQIYRKLNEILCCIKSIGYVPQSESLLHYEEEDMENPLFYHSEKLAIAFGLLKGKRGETLRITKNLRVCKDCHEASNLVSKFYGREIIVRDRSRFHHFRNGVCSCNDYW